MTTCMEETWETLRLFHWLLCCFGWDKTPAALLLWTLALLIHAQCLILHKNTSQHYNSDWQCRASMFLNGWTFNKLCKLFMLILSTHNVVIPISCCWQQCNYSLHRTQFFLIAEMWVIIQSKSPAVQLLCWHEETALVAAEYQLDLL